MPHVKFLRPVRVNGAFYDKGTVGEFAALDWFLSGLLKSGEASLIAEVKLAEPAVPDPAPEAGKTKAAPAEKESAAAPEKPVKTNVRKRNGG